MIFCLDNRVHFSGQMFRACCGQLNGAHEGQVENARGKSGVREAQRRGRARLRNHQGSVEVQAVSPSRNEESEGRMDAGVHGVQFEENAHHADVVKGKTPRKAGFHPTER